MENNELKTVILKNYDSLIEAEIERDILINNGIECFLNDDPVDLFPLVPTLENSPRIIVFERDRDSALEILANTINEVGS